MNEWKTSCAWKMSVLLTKPSAQNFYADIFTRRDTEFRRCFTALRDVLIYLSLCAYAMELNLTEDNQPPRSQRGSTTQDEEEPTHLRTQRETYTPAIDHRVVHQPDNPSIACTDEHHERDDQHYLPSLAPVERYRVQRADRASRQPSHGHESARQRSRDALSDASSGGGVAGVASRGSGTTSSRGDVPDSHAHAPVRHGASTRTIPHKPLTVMELLRHLPKTTANPTNVKAMRQCR